MDKHITTRAYHTPFGVLILGSFDDRLCMCDWEQRRNRETVCRKLSAMLGASYREGDNRLLQSAAEMLDRYFAGSDQMTGLPLLPCGSDFQKTVWEGVSMVPYGSTLSYGALAHRLGRPEAVRAVAAAVGANPLSIFIPCHRITGRNGQLTGYAGGIEAKRGLLALEAGISGADRQ